MTLLSCGEKTYDEWIAYEVVWADKAMLFVWTYNYVGERLDPFPMILPEAVSKVSRFVAKRGFCCMTYMMPRFGSGDHNEALCSHSNASASRPFGEADKWLKEKGFSA